jgi:8-oxo-dGTP pyrophosphatase MutT (NUDIX family)
MADPALTFEEAAARTTAALASRPPRRLAVPGFRPAAVLVPLLRARSGPALLFTERHAGLRVHAGQISFPGGGLEAGEDARAGALREAQEEVGLEPGAAEIVGDLDDRPSTSGYVVTPVVALVRSPPPEFARQRSEVWKVFEVSLERLLAPGALRTEWWDGSTLGVSPRRPLVDLGPDEVDAATGRYAVHFFDVDGRKVWGLTARVVKELLDRAFAGRG